MNKEIGKTQMVLKRSINQKCPVEMYCRHLAFIEKYLCVVPKQIAIISLIEWGMKFWEFQKTRDLYVISLILKYW